MEWKQWASVAFAHRKQLPSAAGLYVVADKDDFVWYVGQATNLQNRWQGRSHHRYPQLVRSNKRLAHRIYWHPFLVSELDEKERFYIALLRPELNGCKVKTYLPKQPQVEREIKRLFKVLNRPTLLYPTVRSVVAGEYQADDGTRCIITIVHGKDCLLLGRSGRKRYSAEVRSAWDGFTCQCDHPSDQFAPLFVNTYSLNAQRFEFVSSDELLWHLSDDLETFNRVVDQGELFGISVARLRDLEILYQLPLANEFRYLREGGKKVLTDVAYLRHRQPLIRPLQS